MNARVVPISLVAAMAACIAGEGFPCSGDAQCKVSADGVCTDVGWCAYPDDDCDGGLRYGTSAPPKLADTCVPASGPDEPPVSHCGNGVIEPPETCDDGNRAAGDTCHPQCVAPGTVLWTVTYDGEAHSDDRGFVVAVDRSDQSFYVSGVTTVSAGAGQDILLQRRWVETGGLVWTAAQGGDASVADSGEGVAVDADGNVLFTGIIRTRATGADIWLRKVDPSGAELWTVTHDGGGDDRGDGIAILPSGTIVVGGDVGSDEAAGIGGDVWLQAFDPDGGERGTPMVRGMPNATDQIIDATADGDDVLVTGRLTDEAGQFRIWTARYDPAFTLIWEDLATADPIGDETRGVGLGVAFDGGCAAAGVLSNDIWVRRFAGDGSVLGTYTQAGSGDMHDEAADVGFFADGSFVVVGFVDFATVGFATSDSWIRHHAADGTVLWTDTYDGPAEEIDKALAVDVTDDDSAIVVGYHTVPGQSRDVWMRRYAI